MSYMNLETELANEYIQKIESAICKKHGQESLLYFDQKKCPERDQWAKLRTLTVIQKLQLGSSYDSALN